MTPFEDPDIFPHEPPPACPTLYVMSMADPLCPTPEKVAQNIGPAVRTDTPSPSARHLHVICTPSARRLHATCTPSAIHPLS
jgi:hypothetical protein